MSCLADLISAYKGIQKEKEALESSLQALGNNKTSSSITSDNEEGKHEGMEVSVKHYKINACSKTRTSTLQ